MANTGSKASLYDHSLPGHRPAVSRPVVANFDSSHITTGCGVAIFHLASARVVLCYHTRDHYWFLPKGRRDAGEEFGRAAEREGFEESGYRNRLLPIRLRHNQPQPHTPDPARPPSRYVTEPVWTQLVPQTPLHQYVLFWYVAETLPPELDRQLDHASVSAAAPPTTELQPSRPYVPPPPYPADLTIQERVRMEPERYEPPRREGTGVDAEELLYASELVPVAEAVERLGRSVQADVVRVGWKAIQSRIAEGG